MCDLCGLCGPRGSVWICVIRVPVWICVDPCDPCDPSDSKIRSGSCSDAGKMRVYLTLNIIIYDNHAGALAFYLRSLAASCFRASAAAHDRCARTSGPSGSAIASCSMSYTIASCVSVGHAVASIAPCSCCGAAVGRGVLSSARFAFFGRNWLVRRSGPPAKEG